MADALLIRKMIVQGTDPHKIITCATTPPASIAYQRKLRLWAADCAARSLHLIGNPEDHDLACKAIEVARQFARGMINVEALAPFDCAPGSGSRFYKDAKRTAFSVASEVRLAAAMTAQVNVFVGTLAAVTHARRAIANATWDTTHAPRSELDWQIGRLLRWMAETEPVDWATTNSSCVAVLRRPAELS